MSALNDDKPPLLRVVGGGEPTDEEMAALVTAVASVAARAQPESDRVTGSRWASHGHGLRRALHPGPGAWKASSLPG